MFDYPSDTGTERRAFLADLREDEVATVVAQAQARRYARAETAVRRGDTDRGLFIVTAGRFEVVASAPRSPGSPRVPGDIFGELSFLDGQPRDADVVAVEDSEALMITHAGLDRLRLREPRLGHLFLLDLGRILSQRLRDQQRRSGATVR